MTDIILHHYDTSPYAEKEFMPVGEFDLNGFGSLQAVFGLEDEIEQSVR